MQKARWNKITVKTQPQQHPTARWGHASCVIDDQVIIFGGYADSNYMNDLWAYSTASLEWRRIETSGCIPPNRSNCSMHYDNANRQLILFGGGGPSKKRFNTISVLDWKTKEWYEINPRQNQPAPWERTYHTSELLYPYLMVFGGEGVTDMDDLWTFNFVTFTWSQIKVDKSLARPCARRFHSSVLINNEFYVIGGCHEKYRPLNDIYSIDLTSLVSTGSVENLKWKEVKVEGQGLLARWGQTSNQYNGKIYIFGGRFSNDLNDILVIDVSKSTLKTLKTTEPIPTPRRRHACCFIGSSLVLFGGFNGNYFNDFHYINIGEVRSKLPTIPSTNNVMRFINSPFLADRIIKSIEQDEIYVHKGLIVNRFDSWRKMEDFLAHLDCNYSKMTILQIITSLYHGYGDIPKDMMSRFSIILNIESHKISQ